MKVNLNNTPTVDQLKILFECCDDNEGHHILWVARNGDVFLSLVPTNLTPIGFQESKPEMQIRYDTFSMGSDYVGTDAAKDESLILEMFGRLVKNWPSFKGQKDVEYIDY